MVARRQSLGFILILATGVLVAVGEWRIHSRSEDGRIAVNRWPRDIMGTECRLIVVVPEHCQFRARDTLKAAEASVRLTEAHMSNWIETSEVSRIEMTPVGESLTLSLETLHVMDAARAAFDWTDGAFDVTCRPQLELWKRAERKGEIPSSAEIATALAASNWSLMERTELGVIKRSDSVGVDLGGIAKGYAIDRALETLQQSDVCGGMIDIGGDLACFGSQANGQGWLVSVRHPFGDQPLAKLRISDSAVATSGNYARYRIIAGRRYSHIVDPRTGQPATGAESVTVIAPTAIQADIWATSLSVLGPEGAARLPVGIEALFVVGKRDDHRIISTPGFPAFIEGTTPHGLIVLPPPNGDDSGCRPPSTAHSSGER